MKYLLKDIIKAIEAVYPRSFALEWDNPGLICGHYDADIESVMIALDADNANVEKAVSAGADLLLTHHPMIFGSVRQINDLGAEGRKLLRLIENKISCYAMHTNFDIAPGGMADEAAKTMGVTIKSPLEVTGSAEGASIGVGFVFDIENSVVPLLTGSDNEDTYTNAAELTAYVKERFELNGAWYYDAGLPIRRIAVCPGSGRKMLEEVMNSGADAFITGDTGHHDGLDYTDAGITLIDAGHFGLEHIYVDKMAGFLKERFPELNIIKEAYDERKFV